MLEDKLRSLGGCGVDSAVDMLWKHPGRCSIHAHHFEQHISRTYQQVWLIQCVRLVVCDGCRAVREEALCGNVAQPLAAVCSNRCNLVVSNFTAKQSAAQPVSPSCSAVLHNVRGNTRITRVLSKCSQRWVSAAIAERPCANACILSCVSSSCSHQAYKLSLRR
jgi:hypothetical protein